MVWLQVQACYCWHYLLLMPCKLRSYNSTKQHYYYCVVATLLPQQLHRLSVVLPLLYASVHLLTSLLAVCTHVVYARIAALRRCVLTA
jgi:hypothetical protein